MLIADDGGKLELGNQATRDESSETGLERHRNARI